MAVFAELLGRSVPLFAVLSVLDNLTAVLGCAIFAASIFRLAPRRSPWIFALCAFLCVLLGCLHPFAAAVPETPWEFLWSTGSLILPFACMAILFSGKGKRKALLVPAGYTVLEELRFVVLLLFFHFNYETRNEPLELTVEFLIDAAAFLAAVLFLFRRRQKDGLPPELTRGAVILFLLAAATVGAFITTILVLGSAFSQSYNVQLMLLLLNLPLLAATVSYSAVTFFRMRAEAENYRQQLNMQIRQFEWMEQMNEDMRQFRHDLPKKLRPLFAYLNEDDPADARDIAEEFGVFLTRSEQTFHTGNYRLDTVLNCEQQLAQKDGVRIVVPFDTVFPADGVEPDDIYTIFPNALDNAIEACRRTDGKKEIFFHSRMTEDTVYITIRNPFTGELKLKNGLPQTGKADRTLHGYGLRSIRKAAARYGKNNVSFLTEDGFFELRIFLRIPPAQGG